MLLFLEPNKKIKGIPLVDKRETGKYTSIPVYILLFHYRDCGLFGGDIY